MTDDELQDWVRDELFWDPKVDSAAIAVSASDGEVTLRGTLGSFRQEREARKAAERVYGVTSVHNNLEVRSRQDRRCRPVTPIGPPPVPLRCSARRSSASARPEQAVREGEKHEFCASLEPELSHDVRTMGVHGSHRDVALPTDLLIGVPEREQLEDVPLPLGQRLQRR
jgi:hypothetical protein